MDSGHQKISTFVRLEAGEQFDRDYYLCHTTRRRFTMGTVGRLLGCLILTLLIGVPVIFSSVDKTFGRIFLLLILLMVPGCLLVYYCVRRLRITHGYATVTSKRLMYYEFNDHPSENYQLVSSVHLDDVTSLVIRIERKWWKRSFDMVVYTSHKGLAVGAQSMSGWFNMFGNRKKLEPGPDSLEFIQQMCGLVAARRFLPLSGSSPTM